MEEKPILPINSKVYAVHKKYADSATIQGGKVNICRVKTYQNKGGAIVAVLGVVGQKLELDDKTHYIYHDLQKAVDAIRTK